MPSRQTGSIRRRGRGFEVRLCVAGHRHSFAVRCEDRREAAQWARNKEAELQRQAERQAEGLPGAVRVSELLRQFRADVLPAKAPGTRDAYEDSLKVIAPYFVDVLHDPTVDKVRKGHVSAFLAWRRTHRPKSQRQPDGTVVVECVPGRVSNRVVQKDRVVLGTLFALAEEREYRDTNPVRGVKSPKVDTRPKVIITEPQYQRLLAACGEDVMLTTYVTLLGEAGLRCESEALWVKWTDVDFDTGFVAVVSGEEHATKTRRTRAVPMTRALTTALREHFRRYRFAQYNGVPTEWLFHHRDGSAHGTAGARLTSLRRSFTQAARRTQLPRGFTQHSLRHRYVTRLLARGHNLALVQKAAGHQSIKTTALYTHLTFDDLTQLVAEAPTSKAAQA